MKIINGKDILKPSNNPWDWLGWGVYFWEQNPEKSLEYAIHCALGKQKFNGEIKNPFVIGAIIELGNCLNLVEPESLRIVKESYLELEKTREQSGEQIPKNKGANRRLDCAVIQNIHLSNQKYNEENPNNIIKPYDTVRSPFHDGLELYNDSNFTDGLHIEISVINTDLIKGYFLPRPIEQYNPYLDSDFNKDEYKNQKLK